VAANAGLKNFFEGTIYKGPLKNFCTPGLNCYSCPGALGSCPIGAFQSVLGSVKYNFSFYIAGFMLLYGGLFGRFICGWLCPFGLIQDLLHKMPFKKIGISSKVNDKLKYLKYLILVLFVLILPIFLTNEFGISPPYFCEFICPAGTLGGGIPLVLTNESLRSALGALFAWKMFLLILTIAAAIIIFRPFCRYICPLGAFYSLFNKISFYKYEVDKDKCTNCSACTQVCKINIEPHKNPNSTECIRCGECKTICPANAIKSSFKL
jgi:polyferredoxin